MPTSTRALRVAVFFAFASVMAGRLSAQDWLAEFPTVDRVIQTMGGANDVDTAARRYSALRILRNVLQVRSGRSTNGIANPPPIERPPAVAARDKAYRDGMAAVTADLETRVDTTCVGR